MIAPPHPRIDPGILETLPLDLYHAQLQAAVARPFNPSAVAALGATVLSRLDYRGVQAWQLAVQHGPSPLIVAEGTNELSDWWRYNFDLDTTVFDGHRWHKGFLEYGLAICSWLEGKDTAHVIGHSLGGAGAQIVAYLRHLTATTFGSPAVLAQPTPLPEPVRARNHIRIDDSITQQPYWARHLGERIVWQPHLRHRGSDHCMLDSYVPVLKRLEMADAVRNPEGTASISPPAAPVV